VQRPQFSVLVFLSLAAIVFSPVLCPAQSDGSAEEVLSAAPDASVPEPSPAPASSGSSFKVGIGVKISLLGAGLEVGVPLGWRFNIRGGVNLISLHHTFSQDGIPYAGSLSWRSGEASLDYFPIRALHLSPGLLFYDGNKVTANVTEAGGNTFTLNGTSYESSTANPLTGTGSLGFNKVAPTFRIGFGNLIPRSERHWSFLAETGIAYQGTPRAALNFSGFVCEPPSSSGPTCVDAATNPAVQANVQGEQTKINNDLKFFKFYPLLSLGVGFSF
jgi:hypothetical protein